MGFDAQRFINGIDNEWAYIPFGGGRRLCKGKEFGYMQVMCIISYMMRHFDVELLDGVTRSTPSEDGMVIAMAQPCRVHYKRRICPSGAAVPDAVEAHGDVLRSPDNVRACQ